MCKALKSAFPDHDWLPWRFVQTEAKFWSSGDNIKSYLEWAGPQINVCLGLIQPLQLFAASVFPVHSQLIISESR